MPTRTLILARAATVTILLGLGGPPLAAQAQPVDSDSSSTLEELAARVTPAVVLIDVTTAADTRQGSGFLVDSDGRILTNYHVIRDARTARVRLSSGDVYEEVEILATDARRDIAILQIAGFELPFLELGNSDSVRVGAQVVLVGSPLGLENTVSTGIVSGRRQEPEGYQLLQVSAPASRGSSGGAVLGSRGQVVGIAVSQVGGGQNLNFAVPINYARGLLSHLGEDPILVLRPTVMAAPDAESTPMSSRANTVNDGLSYRVDDFAGYTVETSVQLLGAMERRTRISYRLIETVGAGAPRIERYLESETTRSSEPFGTVQVQRRERSRVVVQAADLQPISARGETAVWNGTDWRTAEHELRFDGNRAVGLVTDTTGHVVELDRDVPPGIVLSDVRDLAFALLDADSLVGRSVEFTTFDPRTGRIDEERYDILGEASLEIDGASFDALRVSVATGLDNEEYLVRAARPRLVLRRSSDDGSEVETVISIDVTQPRPAGNR